MGNYKTYDTSKGFGNQKKWRKAFSERMSSEDAQIIIDAQEQTPHQILNLPEWFSEQQLKKAYRDLLMQWHPDKNPGNEEEATEKTKSIIAAYTIINSKF